MEKRNSLVFILASFFILSTSFNADAQQQIGVFVSPDSATSGSGYYGSGEIHFLQPNIKEPLAVIDRDTTDNGAVAPNGGSVPIENAQWDRDPGGRITIGRNIPNSPWNVAFDVTYIRSRAVKTVNAPSGGQLLQVFGDRGNVTNVADTARSETDLEVIYGDLMARYDLKFGEDILISSGAGLRFAYFSNDRLLTANGGDCGSGSLTSINSENCALQQEQEYLGIGPVFRTQLGWQATQNLNLFANLGFSLLAGEMDRTAEEHSDVNTGVRRSNIKEEASKTVPVIDSQIGVQYAHALESFKLFFRLGYEIQHWFGMHDRTRPEFSDGVASNRGVVQDTEEADVGFDGPFMRFTAEF